MELFILSILLSLGVQNGINWTLVFFQRTHISKSFLGVFSVSLAVVDTALALFVSVLHLNTVTLLGLKLTRFHVCLLVQILGQVYSSLQGPVLCLAAVDHFCTVTRRVHPTSARARWFFYLVATTVAWCMAFSYVFLLSGFAPVLEDVPHGQIRQCWVPQASRLLQVAILSLVLGCAAVRVGHSAGLFEGRPVKKQIREGNVSRGRRSVICQTTEVLLSTWTPFLLLLVVFFLFPVGIPAHVGLNGAWICFLNSLLIAAVLCVVRPVAHAAQVQVPVPLPPDAFCEWRFKFGLAAEPTA